MNVLVAQSGGPTAAINATIAGIIKGVRETSTIQRVYGALNGILGVIDNNLIDLTDTEIELLFKTPSAALGSCRFKLPSDFNDDIYKRIVDFLIGCNIKCFIYIGGNDSMDTVLKLSKYCEINSIDDLKVIGAPKTIDNDLMGTDHSPGFGSAAKYVATTFLELERDCSVYNMPSVTLVEVMGRNSGWLTAASGLGRLNGSKGPNLIYLCEETFDESRFLDDVKKELAENGPIIVALSEGIKDSNGEYIGGADDGPRDAFGHKNTSGAANYLEGLIASNIGCKVRSIQLNLMQRCAGHIASLKDLEESRDLGRFALNLALDGVSGKMVGLERISNNPYTTKNIAVDIEKIANLEKKVPLHWISSTKNNITSELVEYIRPLIEGEVEVPYKNGVPLYLRLTLQS